MRKFLVLLTILSFSAFGFSSCGKKEEKSETSVSKQESKAPKPLTEIEPESKNPQMPPGHPPINNMPPGHPTNMSMFHGGKTVLTKIDKPVEIPPEVEKTWKVAVIEVVNKKTGKPVKEFRLHKGESVSFEGMKIQVLYIVPHLVVGDKYTSASNEPKNPAILIVVKKDGKTVYAGPIYKMFPQMYNIDSPQYMIVLKNIEKG